MFSVHTTPEKLKTQQSQAAETLECTLEHAHNKVLAEPTWLPACCSRHLLIYLRGLQRKMSKSDRAKNKSEENNKNENFSWSDDEVELLLNVAKENRSSFSKCSVFKMFAAHTKTQSSVFKFHRFQERFRKAPAVRWTISSD